MKKFSFVMMALALLTFTACESTNGWGTKQTVGTGAGAIAGGLLGSQVGSGSGQMWATGAGVLLGALVGSEVGQSLDRADRAYMQQAQRDVYAAPVGDTITWNNPQSGNAGSYTAVRDGRTDSGLYCREYEQTIRVDGRQEQAYGTACRQPDGSWEIMK